VKHLAWLSSHHKSKDGDRRESRRARIDRLSAGEPDYGLPEPGDLAYLLGYLVELGEAESSGNGLVPCTWQTIRAWTELTWLRLSPLEVNALRRLSVAYVSEYYRTDGNELPPSYMKAADGTALDNKLEARIRPNKELR